MNITDKIKKFSGLTLLTSAVSSAAHAHPGHVADSALHSPLHAEHIIVLAVAAAVSLVIYARRNK